MFWNRHAVNSSDWTLERKRMEGRVEGLPQQSYNPHPTTPLTRQLLSNNSFVAVVWLIHPTTLLLTYECGEPQTIHFGVNGWVSNFNSIYGRNFEFIRHEGLVSICGSQNRLWPCNYSQYRQFFNIKKITIVILHL